MSDSESRDGPSFSLSMLILHCQEILSTLIPPTIKKDTFNICTSTRRQITRRFSFFTNIFHLLLFLMPTALFDFIFLDFVSLQDEGREEKIN